MSDQARQTFHPVGNGRFVVLAIGIGLIVLVMALRFSLPGGGPRPAVSPTPDGLERYFTFSVVGPNIDPIVVERERKLFESAVGVLREHPDFFDGWMTIGGVKKLMGDLAGAAAIWEYAGEIRPANSLSFNNLGDLYANFSYDPVKAEAAYRRAITNSAGEDKNAFFWLNLFDLYRYKINDAPKAFRILEEGMAANPQVVDLPLRAARYATEIDNRATALEYYRAAIKLQPKDTELQEEYRLYRAQQE